MKKSLLIAAVAGLAFASCKKDYTCTCVSNGTVQTGSYTVTIHATKGNAKTQCTSYNESDPKYATTCTIQ